LLGVHLIADTQGCMLSTDFRFYSILLVEALARSSIISGQINTSNHDLSEFNLESAEFRLLVFRIMIFWEFHPVKKPPLFSILNARTAVASLPPDWTIAVVDLLCHQNLKSCRLVHSGYRDHATKQLSSIVYLSPFMNSVHRLRTIAH
jgi:hypothetical protein